MKYYRIYMDEIDIVNVEKETDKCVWISGRKVLKGGWQGDIFKTFEEAKSELIRRKKAKLEIEIISHENSVKYLKNEINRVENIKNPDGDSL